MLNTIELKENWSMLKEELKKQYTSLTDEDLILEEGREDEMYERVQAKLGKSTKEVDEIISSVLDEMHLH